MSARARCGFATYFLPDHYEDHWVCEVWRSVQARWVLVDAQLDALQCAALKPDFDPLDVPRDRFIVGGRAWQLCRRGTADPESFGIFNMHGLWFVRGNLVRDVATLNKVELLPWDSWGIIERSDEALSPDDLTFLDNLATLTAGDAPEFETVHALYTNDARIRVPATIHSYTGRGVETDPSGSSLAPDPRPISARCAAHAVAAGCGNGTACNLPFSSPTPWRILYLPSLTYDRTRRFFAYM